MNREYHTWFSHRLNREMELLVFGHAGSRVLVFPTREGRFYDYENWGLVDTLRPSIEAGNLQLYCVDSIDSESLYCPMCHASAKLDRHNRYERYILEEVIPLTELKNRGSALISHGCSIGAYHAVNIAFRHPHLFRKIVALSGRYDLSQPVAGFGDLFGGFYGQDVYFHTPNHYVAGLEDESILHQLRKLEIVLAVGREDPFCDSTVALHDRLNQKSVPNALWLWDGQAHRARYWRQMVAHYL